MPRAGSTSPSSDGSALARRLALTEAHAPLLDGLTASGNARFAWPTSRSGTRASIAARPGSTVDRGLVPGWTRGARRNARRASGWMISAALSPLVAAAAWRGRALVLRAAGARLAERGRARPAALRGATRPGPRDHRQCRAVAPARRRTDGPGAERRQAAQRRGEGAAFARRPPGSRLSSACRPPATGWISPRWQRRRTAEDARHRQRPGESQGGGGLDRGARRDRRGRMDLAVRDGEAPGFDLDRLATRAESASGADRRTRFSALTLQMQVGDGTVRNRRRAITSAAARAAIGGSIGLASRTLDLTLRPRRPTAKPSEARVKLEGPWSAARSATSPLSVQMGSSERKEFAPDQWLEHVLARGSSARFKREAHPITAMVTTPISSVEMALISASRRAAPGCRSSSAMSWRPDRR